MRPLRQLAPVLSNSTHVLGMKMKQRVIWLFLNNHINERSRRELSIHRVIHRDNFPQYKWGT